MIIRASQGLGLDKEGRSERPDENMAKAKTLIKFGGKRLRTSAERRDRDGGRHSEVIGI